MNKKKIKKEVRKFINNNKFIVIIVAALLLVSSSVAAFSGSAQNVTESGDINVYNSTMGGSQELGSVDLPDCANAGHLTGCPTTGGDYFLEGALEVDGIVYTDGGIVNAGTLTQTGNATISGTLNALSSYEVMASTATNTLTVAESGKIIYLATSTPQILPATSTAAGVHYKFVVSAALTASSTITTSDGSNVIQGVIDVNSTMVDCDDEDTITVGASVENVGDYIDVFSDGTNWYVRGDALSATQFACTAT